MNDQVLIDLGCGQGTKKDYIGIDGHDNSTGWENVDITFDLTLGIPLEDNSVDVIYSGHFFEHLAKHQVRRMFQECNRVLKPNGKLDFYVPDLIKVMQNFIAKPDWGWGIDSVFGGQAHEGEYHKTGYWPDVLRLLLASTFFTNLTIEETYGWSQPCLHVTAYKI